MRPGAGKRKGSGYERSVGRRLSAWLTGGDDTQLIRSVSSGGWGRRTVGDEPWRHLGDLAPNGPTGELFRRAFAVECKNHRVVDLWQLLGSQKSAIWEWWTRLAGEINRSGCLDVAPMLVVRARLRPEIVVVSAGTFLPLDSFETVVQWRSLALFPFALLVRTDPVLWLERKAA